MSKHWAVVPAAGSGRRMGSEIPKQYLPLNGRSILATTIDVLASHPQIGGVTVAVSRSDEHWARLAQTLGGEVKAVIGGAERCHSVLACLKSIAEVAAPEDWVFVHDAARPCLRHEDIDALIGALETEPVGAILAAPVRDTLKRAAHDNRIDETIDRSNAWYALTPQVFRLASLIDAIEAALDSGIVVTDEAQAIERLGQQPKLVAGAADNIKVTRPEDLRLAEIFLKIQRGEC
ncbi:MAG: 2-C-methyl-D-erythritol 4-phosphate cytidylyltransferase [Pseudomonadota bacterium]